MTLSPRPFWTAFHLCEIIWWQKWRGHLYAKMNSGPVTQKVPVNQQSPNESPSESPSETGTFSRRCRTLLREAVLRISRGVCCCRYSFCCLNSHHLLAAACGDPEIAFANSFRGPLKKCTSRRPFKSVKVKAFSNFHAVP